MLLAESHSARLFLGVSDGKMTGNGNSPLYCVIVYTLWVIQGEKVQRNVWI